MKKPTDKNSERDDFMFSLNFESHEPIYEQLYNNVVKLIALGVLKQDERLPTVRALAKELGINPNTVAKAYQMLERDGVIYSFIGKGSFVSSGRSSEQLKLMTAKKQLSDAIDKTVELGMTRDDILRLVREYFEGGKK